MSFDPYCCVCVLLFFKNEVRSFVYGHAQTHLNLLRFTLSNARHCCVKFSVN